MTTMNKFHWFWAWDDEKEESWLREMSRNGWHFNSVTFPGNYLFEQGEPQDYVYRLDYFTNRKEMDSYLQIFQDAGWDYLGKMNGWQYFRQIAVTGEDQEIYTDNQSKQKKYQRIMLYLAIFLPIFLNSIITVNRGASSGLIQVMGFLMGLLLLLYVYGMVRLLHRILQLRRIV